eukprot:TRINITY_DN11173_c0_g1_i3.p1 TRINITY_DN11173_c0_g1~~TRINITY_DN11173_c0_g1_i3.p1  ORF type:complete len:658 (-),score=97.52 TRINITY_DN11173_c0_g1_i3:13-1986(-)
MDQPSSVLYDLDDDLGDEISKAIIYFPRSMRCRKVVKIPLCFGDARLEEDFLSERLAIRNHMVLQLGAVVLCCCLLLAFVWFGGFVIIQDGVSWKPSRFDWLQVANLALGVLVGSCRRLVTRCGDAGILCLANVCMLVALMSSAPRQYYFLGSAQAYEVQELLDAFPDRLPGHLLTDTVPILLLCMIVSGTFQMQLRASCCAWLVVSAPIIFLACSLPLPDVFEPTIQHRILLACLIAGHTYVNFSGQVRLEISARKEFFCRVHLQKKLIDEKCLRAGAEFKSQQNASCPTCNTRAGEAGGATEHPSRQGEEERTLASHDPMSSVCSSLLFRPGLDAQDLQLQALKEFAVREAWLVRPEDICCTFQEVLGKGGFGHVFKGTLHGSQVAVKVTSQNQYARSLNNMLAELRILRHVRHVNVVAFYGACICTEVNEILLVEELVSGVSLQQLVTQEPPVADKTRQILLGVCLGLRYLHTHEPPIVHADLTPSNVMVDSPNYTSRLIDFGLSKFASPKPHRRTGTLRWQAPETLTAHQAITESDIFSVGRLAFFVVTGLKPYQEIAGVDLLSFLKEPLCKEYMPSLDWPAPGDLHAECKELCSKCLEFIPEDRPDAQELIEDITFWPCHSLACQTEAGLIEALTSARYRLGLKESQKLLSL